MQLPRASSLAALAIILLGCSCRPAPTPAPPPPRPGPPQPAASSPPPGSAPSPAELALLEHGDRLRGARGVVDVRVAPGRDHLVVELCAAEAGAGLAVTSVPVPIETEIAPPGSATSRGDACGCGQDGVYYDDGAWMPSDCNECRCENGHAGACTLVACEVAILDKIYFAHGDAEVATAAAPVIAGIAGALQDHPRLRLRIIGHAAKNERHGDPLSARRAAAVRDALVAAGIAADRLEVTSVGTGRPASASDDEANRRVEFEVVE